MKVKVLYESRRNYNAALIGMGLAFNKTNGAIDDGIHVFSHDLYMINELYSKMHKRAIASAFMGKGHNKFLRAIHIDLIVQAGVDWWAEQATYTTTDCVQSTSTMHMLKKSGLQNGVDKLVDPVILNRFNEMLEDGADLITLKKNLPGGYQYIRTIHLNYMTLQNMITQRWDHKHPDWKSFCRQVLEQVHHPYFLRRNDVKCVTV